MASHKHIFSKAVCSIHCNHWPTVLK